MTTATDDSPALGVITYPAVAPGYAAPIYKFLDILDPIGPRTVVAGPEICADAPPAVTCRPVSRFESVDNSLLEFVLIQLVMAYEILQLRSDVDVLYFQKGAMSLVVPALVARVCRIPTCVIKVGAYSHECSDGVSIYAVVLSVCQWLTFRIGDACVVFTESERCRVPNDTVFVAYSNYVDADLFAPDTSFEQREFDLGFVGRFSEEKQVREAATAIRSLVRNAGLSACFVGDGELADEVNAMFDDSDDVAFTGWVDRSDLPTYYNRIKYLVHPSIADVLPTTVLEAMSCEAVVLSTGVGSLGDVIDDGETGFLLDDATPAAIRDAYSRAQTQNCLTVSHQARQQILAEFSLTAGRERFAEITTALLES